MAVELAEKYDGEIICADSRTVYRGMDIGTAKPGPDERKRVRHHLLDIVEPDQEFNANDMKLAAEQAIFDITSRSKVPFLVGGTGLYINAVAYDLKFGPKNEKLKSQLESLSLADLQKEARKLGISVEDINFQNHRHLARAVERGGMIKGPDKLRDNCLMIGIQLEPEALKERIASRLDEMINAGLEKEVFSLAKKYGFEAPGLNAICYKEWQGYFAGEQSIEETKQNLYKDTWQYARRQRTWFKKDINIRWTTSVDEASVLAQQFLIQ
jgi:tRNA dimethylallyltransferase